MSTLIYTQIPKVMKDIGFVGKDRRNEQQKYAFRGIEDFYEAAHPAMIEHGVFCAPKVLSREVYRFEKTNDQGRVTTWLHVALEVEHHFYAEDGSSISVTTWGEGLDNSDKATNKAMSGAMKYALIELFCVPTKDVEDSDRTTPENGTSRRPKEVVRTTEDIPITPKSAAIRNDQGAPLQEVAAASVAADTLSTAVNTRATSAADAVVVPSVAAVEYIAINLQKNFHKECRAAVREERKNDADILTYQWLADHKYIDNDKLPTAAMIPAAGWLKTRNDAIAWLKQQ